MTRTGSSSRNGLDIWMFLNQPTEDTEGVAEHKKEVDDFVGQGGHEEKFTEKDQRGNGSTHGGLQRWGRRDVLNHGGLVSTGGGFSEMFSPGGRGLKVEWPCPLNMRFP